MSDKLSHGNITLRDRKTSSLAMRAAELDQLISFMEKCFVAEDQTRLASLCFQAFHDLGLNGSLCFFQDRAINFYSDDGTYHTEEDQLLQQTHGGAACIDEGFFRLYHSAHVGILIRDLPIEESLTTSADDPRHSLHGLLSLMQTSIEARAAALANEDKVAERDRRVNMTLSVITEIIADMEQHQQSASHKNRELVDNMMLNLNLEMSMLTLTDDEERRLRALLEHTAHEIMKAFRDAGQRDQAYQDILRRLTGTMKR